MKKTFLFGTILLISLFTKSQTVVLTRMTQDSVPSKILQNPFRDYVEFLKKERQYYVILFDRDENACQCKCHRWNRKKIKKRTNILFF